MSTISSTFLPLPTSHLTLHLLSSTPPSPSPLTPLLFLHGLGSAASFWLPVWTSPAGRALLADRQAWAVDLRGHGVTKETQEGGEAGLERLGEDVVELMGVLGVGRVVVVGHSMSGLVAAKLAAAHPELVEKLFLLSPVLTLPEATRTGMRGRAALVSTREGHAEVAMTVSTKGISPQTLASQPTTAAFIHHLVLTTPSATYGRACTALANSTPWEPSKITCPTYILGGGDDYMADAAVVEGWAGELTGGKSGWGIMKGVGHWGGVEAPGEVAESLAAFIGQ